MIPLFKCVYCNLGYDREGRCQNCSNLLEPIIDPEPETPDPAFSRSDDDVREFVEI